jgi:predicted nuclease of predicted toxin-antitoxin system
MSDSSSLEPLLVRLYFDRHIIAQLAVDLRRRGFDIRTTEEALLDTATDGEQLDFATQENRALLMFNIRDFARLHED